MNFYKKNIIIEKKIITIKVHLTCKIYKVLIFLGKTIQIFSSNYTPLKESTTKDEYINKKFLNLIEKNGYSTDFLCSIMGKLDINENYENQNNNNKNGISTSNNTNKKYLNDKIIISDYKENYTSDYKKNYTKNTYSKDKSYGDIRDSNKNDPKLNITDILYNTTDKKNQDNTEREIKNLQHKNNDTVKKKLDFNNVEVDDNSEVEYCIEGDNNIKLNNKEKVINGKTQQIIKTETNNRCCCCQ